MRRMSRVRRGFTLIEIAICLFLVSVAVLTIFMLIPSGARTQATVRYKIIASAKALEMIELLRGSHPSMVNDARDLDKEGVFPWDTRMCYKSMAPDLEAYLEGLRASLRPLPEAIGRRLDSENDEIRRLLAAGGRLYYFFPNEPVGVLDDPGDFNRDEGWMPKSSQLIVGVTGHPQHNSILYHPSLKVGPYQDFYPSPPTHGRQENSDNWADQTRSDRHKQNMFNYDALCRDPDIAQVMYSDDTWDSGRHFGYLPYAQHVFRDTSAILTANAAETKRRIEGYLCAAVWYLEQQGIDRFTLMTIDSIKEAECFAEYHADDWRKVLAMRYVAHAAACLTACFDGGLPGDGTPIGGDPEVTMVMGGVTYWDDRWRNKEKDDWVSTSVCSTSPPGTRPPSIWRCSTPTVPAPTIGGPVVRSTAR